MARASAKTNESNWFKSVDWTMKRTLQQNLVFLIPYFTFLLIAGVFLTKYSKGEAHLLINECRYGFCDYFFFLATYAGDGIAVVLIILSLAFIKYRYAIFVASANIVAALITQTLKHSLYSDVVRPVKFFDGAVKLKLVPWVENYMHNSFPSGHTTAAFATCFSIALISENKFVKMGMFFIALTIGFSRVYLSQHFLNDVYAGSLIGIITSLLIYQYCFLSEKVKNNMWMEKSFIKNK